MKQNVKLTLNVSNLEGGNSNNIKLNWLRLVKCKYIIKLQFTNLKTKRNKTQSITIINVEVFMDRRKIKLTNKYK